MTTEPKLCAHCKQAEVPTIRHTYCPACRVVVQKESTRRKDDKRLKGCIRCAGPNFGRGSRYCAECREAMLPVWQRAETERAQRRAASRMHAQGKRSRLDTPEGMKWCNYCKQYRRLANFSPDRSKGTSAYCIPCTSDYNFARRLERVFGITRERYEELLALQDGRCAICLRSPRSQRLAVDHDHKTGEVRGLLCKVCNHRLLGAAKDNIETLRRAVNYLEYPPAGWTE